MLFSIICDLIAHFIMSVIIMGVIAYPWSKIGHFSYRSPKSFTDTTVSWEMRSFEMLRPMTIIIFENILRKSRLIQKYFSVTPVSSLLND